MSAWVVAAMWAGSVGLVIGLLLFISSPKKDKFARGSFSIQHLLVLQSVWEPGKAHLFQQKQVELADEEADPGPKKAGG